MEVSDTTTAGNRGNATENEHTHSSTLAFSILTTKSTNQCKTFSLNNDGGLVKSSIANAYDGVFKVHAVQTMVALSGVLDRMIAK